MTNFAIVCMGRTGSTWLVSLLDSHPDIECRGELFRTAKGDDSYREENDYRDYEARGVSPAAYLRDHAFRTDLPVHGFKMPHEWIQDYAGIYDVFRALDFKIILLRRRSSIDHYASIQLANRNNNWSSQTPYADQEFKVKPTALADFMLMRRNIYRSLEERLAGLPLFQVDYESLGDEATHRAMLDFLGVRAAPLTAATSRSRTTGSGGLREALAHFEWENPVAVLRWVLRKLPRLAAYTRESFVRLMSPSSSAR